MSRRLQRPRTRRRVWPAVCAAGLWLAAHVAAAAPSEFAGYRIPEHRWSSWSVNFSGNGTQSRSDQAGLGRSWRGHLNGGLTLNGAFGLDSDDLSYGVSVRQSAGGLRSGQRNLEDTPQPATFVGRQRSVSEITEVGLSVRHYPFAPPLGLLASGSFSAGYDQEWRATGASRHFGSDEQRNVSDTQVQSHRYASTASLGVALGRLRDATPVQTARILELRLLRTGALSRPLSDLARGRVAALFAAQPAFSFAHERSARWFWRELERVLREDGALAGDRLDAFSTLRVLEGVSLGAPSRPVGTRAELFAQASAHRDFREEWLTLGSAQLQDGVLVASTSTARHEFEHRRADGLGVGFLLDHERPLGLRWQLDANHLLSWNDRFSALSARQSVSLTWMVADRWQAGSTLSHSLSARGRGGARRIGNWSVTFANSVGYYIEDSWSLGASWQHRDDHGTTFYRRDDVFFVGVTRRLSGRFDAPGLVEPMRLSPAD